MMFLGKYEKFFGSKDVDQEGDKERCSREPWISLRRSNQEKTHALMCGLFTM